MPWASAIVGFGALLLLGVLPLAFSTSLADAVLAPKHALFLSGCALTLAGWAMGATAGVWAWWPGSPVARAAFLFYAWWAGTGLLAGLPPQAVPGTLDAGLLAGLVLAWASVLEGTRARRWTGWICASALVVGFYSHLQRLTPMGLRVLGVPIADPVAWNHPHLSQERTIATFGNPDYLAAWLVVVLPLALSWLLTIRRPAARWVALSAWILVAVAMILTLTRAAWVGAAAGGAVWLACALGALPRPERTRILRLLIGAGALLVLLLGSVVTLQAEKAGPFTVAARLQSFRDFQDLSFRTRLFFWKSALITLAENPLAGTGPGGFPTAALQHRDLEPVETRYPPRTPENPHNQYLTVAAEAGLPGVLFLGGLLVLFFYRGRAGGGLEAAGLLGAGAAHWANQLFISSTLTTEVLWVFLVALAASRETPSRPSRPAALPLRVGVGLAGLLLLAGLVWLSGLIVFHQRQVWLGDHARFQARTLLESHRATGQQILPFYQRALDDYLAASRSAPPWEKGRSELRVGRLYEEIYHDLTDRQAEPLRAQAHQAYLAALEEEPSSPNAWASLARILALAPASRAQALPVVDQALTLDPRNPDYLDLKARILLDLGRPQEALASWQTALAIRPDLPRLLLGTAESLLLLQRDLQAERALERAVELDPSLKPAADRIRADRQGAKELQTDRRNGATNPVGNVDRGVSDRVPRSLCEYPDRASPRDLVHLARRKKSWFA
jgi:O-antigen ligase